MDHRYEIRRISIWPATKLAFVLFLVIGILVAIFYAVIMAGVGFLASAFGPSGFGNDLGNLRNLGLFLIPLIAISYAVFGTICVVIWLLLYNLIASIVGGVEVSLRPVEVRTIGVEQPPLHFAAKEEKPGPDGSV